MRFLAIFAVFFLTFFYSILLSEATATECKKPRVTMVLNEGYENPFWGPYAHIAKAAAKDLNIELNVEFVEPNNRFEYFRRINEIVNSAFSPDYLALFLYSSAAEKTLEIINNAKINTISLNSALIPRDKNNVGDPRQKFKHWLLHSYADVYKAGYDLMDELARTTRIKGNIPNSKTLNALVLGGSRDTGASTLSIEGMLEYTRQENSNIKVKQIAYTNWTYEQARKVSEGLLLRHGKVDLIWTAWWPMGKAALDVWKETFPNESIPSIGVFSNGTVVEGKEHISNGDFASAVGGHVFEGAWILSLIVDHFNGIDFLNEIGTTFPLKLTSFSNTMENQFSNVYENLSSENLDFSIFSKCHNPNLKAYNFSVNMLHTE